MAEKKENKTNKRRTQVKELPKNEKELTPEEQKKVKGGGWLMTPAGQAKGGSS
ncbi:MAG TPA: hypothetical protein VGB73_14365 [Pyrinomonadaceae bacterium]|jgi:hypothetical protein